MDLIRQSLSVLFVLGLLVGLLWWLKGRTIGGISLQHVGKRPPRKISAVERLVLSPQHALHLVRVGDRALVLAVYSGGCTVLENRPWQDWENRVPAPDTQFGAAQ